MTDLQKRIFWTVAAFSILFNSCALGFCLWHDNQMSKAGISIEEIIAGKI